jgi:valyl-tRNA synthetase
LSIRANSLIDYKQYLNIISKLANIEKCSIVADKVPGAASFMAGTDEFFVPLANSIDVPAEKERMEKEIDYLKGFLKSVEAKLSNDRFVQNANVAVVDNERRKKDDALSKIKILEEGLAGLGE